MRLFEATGATSTFVEVASPGFAVHTAQPSSLESKTHGTLAFDEKLVPKVSKLRSTRTLEPNHHLANSLTRSTSAYSMAIAPPQT